MRVSPTSAVLQQRARPAATPALMASAALWRTHARETAAHPRFEPLEFRAMRHLETSIDVRQMPVETARNFRFPDVRVAHRFVKPDFSFNQRRHDHSEF